jgi:hypothetical protein
MNMDGTRIGVIRGLRDIQNFQNLLLKLFNDRSI